MANEIERKFLIDFSKVNVGEGSRIAQGYIPTQDKTAVRIRIKGDIGLITIKGENKGMTRSEYEYPIPVKDAEEMMEELCSRPFIDKTRYEVIYTDDFLWEIDVFHGENEGLFTAEIELDSEDTVFEIPEWVICEVTDDPRYYNSSLVTNPYKNWK